MIEALLTIAVVLWYLILYLIIDHKLKCKLKGEAKEDQYAQKTKL